MISFLAAAAVACSGMTTTYDLNLSVNLEARSLQGTLVDSDGGHNSTTFAYAGLELMDDCLSGDGIEVCLSPDRDQATFWMALENAGGTRVETGNLDCQ